MRVSYSFSFVTLGFELGMADLIRHALVLIIFSLPGRAKGASVNSLL